MKIYIKISVKYEIQSGIYEKIYNTKCLHLKIAVSNQQSRKKWEKESKINSSSWKEIIQIKEEFNKTTNWKTVGKVSHIKSEKEDIATDLTAF